MKKLPHKPHTLIVEFAPRGDESRTKKLRTYLTDIVADYSTFEMVDVAQSAPELLNTEIVTAYYKRNYQGETLTAKEDALLQNIDSYRDAFLAADIVLVSSPVYNFGFPAAVKAWIDAVMQKESVYTTNEQGHVPLLHGKKVCFIYTSGITHDQLGENENWNGILSTGLELFEYMGAEVRSINIEGVDMLDKKFIEYRTKEVAYLKAHTIAKEWYEYPFNVKTY